MKTNEVLRERIFDGSLPICDLVQLNSSELATKDLADQRTRTFRTYLLVFDVAYLLIYF